jgi:UDP-2,3-diacylglucosamine hydrolase
LPAQGAEGRVYFLSDLHLGAYPDAERTSLPMLVRFLDHVAATGGRLYIVGDLLDFWFEYPKVVPRYPFKLLAQLRCMVDGGCEIVYIAGNHDYWMGDFLRNEVGVKTVSDALDVSIAGRRFFISHGDGIATTGQMSYRVLKYILHSRAVSFGFRLVHPDIGLGLAGAFSKVSRRRSSRNHNDPKLEIFVRQKAREGFDHVVLGHLHKPQIFEIGATSCLVVGDWIDNFTYGVYEAGKLSLEHWPRT